jgi:hypothetical protein
MTTFVFLSLTKIRPRFLRFLSSSFRHSFRFDLLKIYSKPGSLRFVFVLATFSTLPFRFISELIFFYSLRFTSILQNKKPRINQYAFASVLKSYFDLQKAVFSLWLLVCMASSAYSREY